MDWKSLGIELDISLASLNDIEADNKGVGACRGAMVETWLATDGGASWNKLVDSLVTVHQNVRAGVVRELGRQAGELYLGGCGFGCEQFLRGMLIHFSCKSSNLSQYW